MIQNLIWKLFGKKYLLGGVVELYKFINGKKTLLVSVGMVAVYAAKTLGYLPADLADQLLALLGGGGGISLLHKFQKWDEDFKLQERAAELRGEAFKTMEKDGILTAELNSPDSAVRG